MIIYFSVALLVLFLFALATRIRYRIEPACPACDHRGWHDTPTALACAHCGWSTSPRVPLGEPERQAA